jgi:hypothetical protein
LIHSFAAAFNGFDFSIDKDGGKLKSFFLSVFESPRSTGLDSSLKPLPE